MIEQELKDIWRNSSETERIRFDLSKLLIEMDQKMKHINKAILRRDRLEIGAAIFAIFMYGYLTYEIPFIVSKIAGILVIGALIYIIYKLRSNRKNKIAPNVVSTFREQLIAQKTFLKKQAEMLNSVLYWYVLPPFLTILLFIVGLGDPEAHNWSSKLTEILPMTMKSKIIFIVFMTLFNIFVVWLNKRAVAKTLTPLIERVERAQLQLDAEE